MAKFEIVDYIPKTVKKHDALHAEVMEVLPKLSGKKSIHIAYDNVLAARNYAGSLKKYLKDSGIHETYYVSMPSKPDSQGGFHVYVGKRAVKE